MQKRLSQIFVLGAIALLSLQLSHAALVARWAFDEANGTSAADTSGSPGAAPALLEGGATFQPAAGRFGGAVYLDGANGQVNGGDRADLEFTAAQSFTLAVWFKSDGDESTTAEYVNINQGLITKGYHLNPYDTAGYYQLQINCAASGTDSFVTFDSRESSIQTSAFRFPSAFTSPDFVNNNWHHVAAVIDRANSLVTIYVDGNVYATKAIVAGGGGGQWAMGVNSSPLIIGNHFGRFTKGWFDDCGIWNEALTAAQISAIYTNGIVSTDSDNDGLPDSWEQSYFGNLNQTATGDPDADGLTNLAEYNARTYPNDPDSDDDTLTDGAEVNIHGTNPLSADTDGDTWPDQIELTYATSPTNPASRPFPYNYLQAASLHINEFISENLPRVNDPYAPVDMDGEYPDWIEIKNDETISVNLQGYSLSDDPNRLDKWTFASTSVAAGGYLVVYASGKDRAISGVQPHTNFKLKSAGQLFLSRADGTNGMFIVHSVNYAGQRQTVSYGLISNNPAAEWKYMTRPTPGAANNDASAVTNFVKDTTFDVDRGFYSAPFTVQITSATPGATIAYTLNGSVPSPSNGVQVAAADAFTAPTASVQVTRTTLLRARAWKTGMGPSDVDTQSYIFPAEVLTQNGPPASMNLTPADTLPWGTSGGDLANMTAFPGLSFYGVNPGIVNDSSLSNRFVADDLKRIAVVSLVMDWRQLFGTNAAGLTDGGIYPPASGVPNEGVDRPASLELINPAGDPVNPNQVKGFQMDGNVHIFGGTSQTRWKSYKLSMRFQCANEVAFPVYGPNAASEFKNFILDARINNTWNHPDPNTQGMRGDYVNDQVVADLQNAMSGRGGFHNRPVHLFLNGLYWGLYSLHEKPDHHFAAAYYGGDSDDWDVFKHSVSTAFTESDPLVNTRAANPALPVSRANATVVTNYEMMLDRVGVGFVAPNPVPDLSVLANYEAVAEVLDIDEFINYMIVNFVAGNWDWSDKNLYAAYHRSGNGKWYFYSWDAEHVFRTGTENFLTGNGNESPRPGQPKGIHNRLKVNPEYRLKFADAIRRHLFDTGVLTAAGMSNAFNFRFQEIDAAIRGESARWGHIRAAARSAPNTNIPFKRTDWLNRVRQLIVSENGTGPALVQNRWNLLMAPAPATGSFRTEGLYPNTSAPEFSHYGGVVPAGFQMAMSHANATGVIYYTTDGSDPRVYGANAIAATAQTFAGPLTLNAPTMVRARVLRSGEWSAITEAMYYPPQDLTSLMVTELMYNPPGEGLTNGSEFEFLELQNVGTNTLNLSGLAFTTGITFSFTNGTVLGPGQFFLLARNPDAMITRYPGVTVNGVYSGSLDNAGENLAITHEVLGTTLLTFDYNDRAPWPVAADGFGYSAVLSNPAARPNVDEGRNWRASAQWGGSPGAPDPDPGIPSVLVNEVLSASVLPAVDFVELYNPNSTAVNIGGWFLTDEATVPMKYRIPDGTMIQPGEFKVFTEADFNPTPGTNNSFSLSSLGEAVYLFSGDAATNLTGYSHGFSFGAAAAGVTFGRHVISTGREHFTAQTAATPGNPNAGPVVGPVVISEIMYHPPDIGTNDNTAGEFIELVNITESPVPLYDPAIPTNTWQMTEAVDLVFPTNVTLAAGERLVAVSFDPVADPLALAAFRQTYGLSQNLQVVGPYAGKLDNSGESVELKRPVISNEGGVALVMVDRVTYRDQSPWPQGADGSGASLHRIVPSAYGNDPTNWLAAMPTAGGLLPSGEPPQITQQPISLSVLETESATFTVGASGTGPLTYYWQQDGIMVATNQSGVLNLSNVRLDQAGVYAAIVIGPAGVVVSSNALLAVQALPKILAQPLSTNVYVSNSVTLTVVASSAYPLTYQWQKDEEDIVGATQPSLTLTNVQLVDQGYYRVRVTDLVGTRVSDSAWVQPMVRIAYITKPPASMVVTAGVDVVFSASISGYPPPFTFQFHRLTTPIETVVTSATNVSFTLRNVQFTNATLYRIIASNVASSGLSASCNLTVNSWPLITVQPTNQYVSSGQNAQLSVTAVGTGTLTYRWYYQATNLLTWATTSALTITNVQAGANTGDYFVTISNAYGVVTSEVAAVALPQPALILRQPEDVAVSPGSNATFRVVAGGGSPYAYQWYFNNTAVAGAVNSTWVVTNAQMAQVGGYQVVVANDLGAVTSRVAQLTLAVTDADGDGLPDDWEQTHGLGPGAGYGRDDDPDGDGRTNWEEYLSGTHPQDSVSVLKISPRAFSDAGAQLSFTAMPGIGYTVLFQATLTGTNWLTLTNIPPQAGTNVMVITDPGGKTNATRYYLIATP